MRVIRKITINPAYESEREAILRIPEERYDVAHTFCEDRNRVTKTTIDGKDYVIKRFKRPPLINRFAYTFLRKDKARRSYDNAHRLRDFHFDTPEPVAYIALYRQGLFHTGYYISRFLPSIRFDEMLHNVTKPQEREQLFEEFIQFTYDLHRNGIYQKDYNSGNILVCRDGAHYRFSLVDINRMRFQYHPTFTEAMTSFDQMGLGIPYFTVLVPLYAKLVDKDPERGLYLMLRQRYRRYRKIKARKIFKYLFRVKG